MFSTDMYKIVKSETDLICFDRAVLPRSIYFGVIGLLAAIFVVFLWGKPRLETWFWFSSIAFGLMVYGLVYLFIPDKRITLENNGSIFVLKGKHWFGKRNCNFSSEGEMTVVRVVGSGGNSAMNYILEIKTLDGLRFMLGFYTHGSFKKERLEELGRFLEKKTEGRLVLTDK